MKTAKTQIILAILLVISLFAVTACGEKDDGVKSTTVSEDTASDLSNSDKTEALGENEVVEAGFFSVAYPKEWTYDEENASIDKSYANIKFIIKGEEDKVKYSVTINADKNTAKSYRKDFINNGIDLRDLADGKLDSLDIDGTAFFRRYKDEGTATFSSGPKEIYAYRHEPSGINYSIEFTSADSVDTSTSPFSDIIGGIRLNLTDEGNKPTPWPWEGTPWTPDLEPQMAGSFTITPAFLKANEPFILNSIMNTTFTVADGLIYTVTKKDYRAYKFDDKSVTLENAVALDEEYEKISTDKTGKLYLSRGIPKLDVYEGFKKSAATEISHDLVMHNSGEWGLTFWVNADPMKVTVKDGILKEEPWVLADLTKSETRKGFFKMISEIRISDSHIMVAGSAADDSGEKIVIYDFDGNELFALENTEQDRSGLGHITGIAETPNGFIATDGNMRRIALWNSKGTFIGKIEMPKLIGAKYCWLEDMQLLDDGSILIAVSQERDDNSADELLFFRLTGF